MSRNHLILDDYNHVDAVRPLSNVRPRRGRLDPWIVMFTLFGEAACTWFVYTSYKAHTYEDGIATLFGIIVAGLLMVIGTRAGQRASYGD